MKVACSGSLLSTALLVMGCGSESLPEDNKVRKEHQAACTVPAYLAVRQYDDLVVRSSPDDPDSYASLSEEHRAALDRRRRLIVNSDGNEAWGYEPSDAEDATRILLEKRLYSLDLEAPDNAIDAYVFEVTTGGFGSFTHPNTAATFRDFDLVEDNDCIAQVDGSEADEPRDDGKVCNAYDFKRDYDEARIKKHRLSKYIDVVQESLNYVRGNGREFFVGFRMNDTHDASPSKEWYENNYSAFKLADEGVGDFLFANNPYRKAHTTALVNKSDLILGKWSAVDYGAIHIRNTMEASVKEVIANYDVDGVQLNFMRHPVFFRRTGWSGGEASDCERAKMTDMMIRIRNQANKRANVRGRPVLVSILIPDSLDYAHAIGLDVREWYRRGLVDLVVGADYVQFQNWQASVDEASGYPIKFYAGFTDPRFGPPKEAQKVHLNLRDTGAGFRGRGHEAWIENVDGIQLSNGVYGRADYDELYRELASKSTTSASEMLQFGSFTGAYQMAGNPLAYYDYLVDGPRPFVAPNRPRELPPKSTTRWSFRVGRGEVQRQASVYIVTQATTDSQRGDPGSGYNDSKFFLRIIHDLFSPVDKLIRPAEYWSDLPVPLKHDLEQSSQMFRFDIPQSIAEVLAAPTFKVDVVNSDEAPITVEDVILHTSPDGTEPLRDLLSFVDFD